MGRVPWRPKFGASFWVMAPLVVVLTIAGFASGGFGGLLVACGLIAVVTALYSVVTGRVGWASVPGRKVAAVVLAVSLVVMGVGATLLPPRADESLASAESSASPQAPIPLATDAPQPIVAPAPVHLGSFGAAGVTKQGTPIACTTPTNSRLRWLSV